MLDLKLAMYLPFLARNTYLCRLDELAVADGRGHDQQLGVAVAERAARVRGRYDRRAGPRPKR